MTTEHTEKSEGEILSADGGTVTNVNVLAMLQESPNFRIALEEIEKSNPGFLKNYSDVVLKAHIKSVELQSSAAPWRLYSNLFLQLITALSVLSMIGVFIYFLIFELRGEISSLLTLIIMFSLIVLYAVSQGGKTGFQEIAAALAEWLRNQNKK